MAWLRLPMNTYTVELKGAPGKGHRYQLECYDQEGKLLGTVETTLAAVDQNSPAHLRLRMTGHRTARAVRKTGLFYTLLPI